MDRGAFFRGASVSTFPHGMDSHAKEKAAMNHETNWAGNYAYRAKRVHWPATVDDVREIVRSAPKIRALAARPAQIP